MEGDVAEKPDQNVDGAAEVDGAGHHGVHPGEGGVGQALVDGENVPVGETTEVQTARTALSAVRDEQRLRWWGGVCGSAGGGGKHIGTCAVLWSS